MSGQLSISSMSEIKELPKSYFKEKWYIREDLFPEPFNLDRSVGNCNIMYQVGNCFDTKEQALVKCNAIRVLLGVSPV